MIDYKRHFDKYCSENKIKLQLSFDMPLGYENANGTFDVKTKTVYINAEYLCEARIMNRPFSCIMSLDMLYSIYSRRSSATQSFAAYHIRSCLTEPVSNWKMANIGSVN